MPVKAPPIPISTALMPNTDNNPNTEATKPNTVGAVTRTTLLVVWRRPKVSPERPAADLLNSNIVVIG